MPLASMAANIDPEVEAAYSCSPSRVELVEAGYSSSHYYDVIVSPHQLKAERGSLSKEWLDQYATFQQIYPWV